MYRLYAGAYTKQHGGSMNGVSNVCLGRGGEFTLYSHPDHINHTYKPVFKFIFVFVKTV